MRRLVKMMVVHTLLVLILGIVAVFVLYGRENTWKLIFGDGDQGYQAFETLVPGDKPNHYLIAPAGLTPATAPPDAPAPIYRAAPAVVLDAFAKIALAEPLVTEVARFPATNEARFVQRTSLMRFPDTIWVKAIPVDGERTALAVFSRSQIGHSDLGVNADRVRRWIAALDAALPLAPNP